MKKRLLSLLGLFLLILPLAAGCGEDEEQVKVNTSIAKPSNMNDEDIIYDVLDCSKISNGGTYSKGASVTLTAEVNTAACKFHGWRINGEEELVTSTGTSKSRNVKSWSKTIVPTEDIYVEAIVSGINTNASLHSLNFLGIYDSSDENILNSRIKFPSLKENSNNSITYSNGSAENGTVLSNVLLGTNQGDLNYIYVDDVFKPYKLQWEVAEMDVAGMCKNATWKNMDVSNPNEFTVEQDMCLRARLYENDADKKQESLNNALNNLLESEAYLTTNSDGNSISATNANVAIDSQTFYVYNLKNLFNTATSENNKTVYYAINDAGYLEGVKTLSNGDNLYSLCREEDLTTKCDVNNVYNLLYIPSEDYESLAIADLLTKLKGNVTLTDVESIEYFYDPLLSDINIKSFKLKDFDKYYVTIIDSNGIYYNSQTKAFPSNNNAINASIYSINIESDDIDEEKLEVLNAKLDVFYNTIHKFTSLAANRAEYVSYIEDYLLNLIFEEVNSNPDLKSLKNYEFVVNVNMNEKSITINSQSAVINLGSPAYAVDIYGLGKEEYNVCSATKDDLLSCAKFNSLANYVMNYLTGSMEDLYSVKIAHNREGKVVYTIQLGDSITDFPIEIIYDEAKNTFTSGDISLKFVYAEKVTLNGFTKITLEDDTVLGKISQILEVQPDDNPTVTTTLNDTSVQADDSVIRALYTDILNGDIYTYDDGKFVLQVTEGTSKKMYLIKPTSKDHEYEISYGANEYVYILTIDSIVPANS